MYLVVVCCRPGYLYVKDDDLFIGSSYKKALYVEYTDATFSTRKVRGERDKHLGLLGPIIKAEVNDVIEVVFFNKASRPYSIQPQGVRWVAQQTGGQSGCSSHGGACVCWWGEGCEVGRTVDYQTGL